MRYFIKFSYDGSNYCGYQRQKGLPTVQEQLEKALKIINNNVETPITAAGRTDRGVHALGQTAHFDLTINITEKKLKKALNSNLPEDIHVFSTEEVEENFHARYQAKKKTYKYIINLGEYNPLERNYVYQYNYQLDIPAMKQAIKYLKGTHDFRAFVTENITKDNCVRTISHVQIEKDKSREQLLIITFSGTGFLRYQVRNMVGLLLKVGQNKVPPIYVQTFLEGKDRRKNGVTAPSQGLYLVSVEY